MLIQLPCENQFSTKVCREVFPRKNIAMGKLNPSRFVLIKLRFVNYRSKRISNPFL